MWDADFWLRDAKELRKMLDCAIEMSDMLEDKPKYLWNSCYNTRKSSCFARSWGCSQGAFACCGSQ